MFTITRHKAFPVVFSLSIFLLIFIVIARIKPALLTVCMLPLRMTASFTSDVKAMLSYKFILAENTRFKKELAVLASEALKVKELTQENERLKEFLSFKEQVPFTAVASRVIVRDPGNWSKGVVIDKGALHGIKAGNPVITKAGLIGRIIETSARESKVMLLNDQGSSVSAIIQRSREDGLITGTLLGAVVMRYMDTQADVAVGDTVVTSGITDTFPPSLFIGRVEAVKNEPQGLGKYCSVKPYVDLRRVEEVLVILNYR